MADLVRTDDADLADEGDDFQDGPVLAKRRGLPFKDLVSEDEEDAPGQWDFDVHEASAVMGAGPQTGGLQAKIHARLEDRRESGAGAGEENEAGASEEKASKDKQPRAPAPAQGASEHLRTGIHFADLRLSRPLLRAVAELRFESPTPIQRDVVPPALRGLDVLATAETGSGKTASFLLPTLERLCQSSNVRARRRDAGGRISTGHVATKAMIMIPTRELAVQCHAMLRDLAKYTLATYQLVAGGFVAHDQASSLRRQPDIVIATPGRLLDHLLNSHSVHMELLEIVVFDEADRLLELGFRDECQEVLKRCSRGRQTMLFSATMNASVQDLATLALVKPVRVHANPPNRVAETLEQEFVKAPSEAMREAVLMSLCARIYTAGVIIFCATRQAAHRLAIIFGLCGLRFAEIHGNLPQGDRVLALQRFQQQEADFLLATDLAARGLDLCNVETVVNFHLPVDVSRYIHRVGRTARMGRTGRAVTIYCPEEYAKVKKLGKQCCSKVKSKVLKRTVAADTVQHWADKIAGFKEDIEAILQDESLERELRLADMLTGKSDNMEKHRAEIRARPAKTWFMTNNEKKQLKTTDVERLQKREAAEAAEAAQEPARSASAGKKRRMGQAEEPVDEDEAAQERRRKRFREQFHNKRKAEIAEREQSKARIRLAVKRTRNAAKPVKGGDAPQPAAAKKKKKRKSKGKQKGR